MIDRRQFLKGLLAAIAATAISKNGVLQPSEEITVPTRTVFDMVANTWHTYKSIVLGTKGVLYFWDGTRMLIADGKIAQWTLDETATIRIESLAKDWTATLHYDYVKSDKTGCET